VLEPVAQQEGVVFVEITLVEDQEELAAIWIKTLIECGTPDGKYQRSPTLTSSTKIYP